MDLAILIGFRARRHPIARLVGIAVLLAASHLLASPSAAQAPLVWLDSPVAGSTLVGPVTLSARASDDVDRVRFMLDGALLAEVIEDPSGTWTWPWNAAASNGNHTVSAEALDAAGNVVATASAFITIWRLSGRQASVFTPKPLPVVRNRLGLYPRDFIWFGNRLSPTTVTVGYMTQDRDLLHWHDLDWFLTYYPDWLMRKCDGTPLQYWPETSPLWAIDTNNPAVREYQFEVIVRTSMNYGFDGIAIDNFSFNNHFGRCGAYDAQGVFHPKYTGDFVDATFAADVLDWIIWLADRVHAVHGLVAINVIDLLHPSFETLAAKMDLVYFEGGGFIAGHCRPAWTDDMWRWRFQALRKVALERAMVVQDQTCDYMSQLTPELVSWDVANFFLVRGDRSYFSMSQSYRQRPLEDPDYDGPELHAPLGEPIGEPQQHGVVWTRQYQNGFVAVNPSSTESAVLPLGFQKFKDVYGRPFSGFVALPPASGRILLADGFGIIPGGIVSGAGDGGGPHVRGFSALGDPTSLSFLAYPASFPGGVRLATADVSGDGIPDIVTGAGPGGGPHVQVFDGATAAVIRSFFAYPAQFSGGVFVAAGDLNGDRIADIVTGAGPGGGPHVQVFDGATAAVIRSFFAYPTQFTGGVFVAAGDLNGDGVADIVTGAGPGGGPHVQAFDGTTGALIQSFFAYPTGFTGGVFVAAGDLDGDGIADIVTGAGPGGGPHVQVMSGATGAVLASFFAYHPSLTLGVRVAAADMDGDGKAEIITAPGPGGGPHVRAFSRNADGSMTEVASFFAYGPGFLGGVFVAGIPARPAGP